MENKIPNLEELRLKSSKNLYVTHDDYLIPLSVWLLYVLDLINF